MYAGSPGGTREPAEGRLATQQFEDTSLAGDFKSHCRSSDENSPGRSMFEGPFNDPSDHRTGCVFVLESLEESV